MKKEEIDESLEAGEEGQEAAGQVSFQVKKAIMFTRNRLIMMLGAAIVAFISWQIGYRIRGHIGATVAGFFGVFIFMLIYQRLHSNK